MQNKTKQNKRKEKKTKQKKILLYITNFLIFQWSIKDHVKTQQEKEIPQRKFIHEILTLLRLEVKAYNSTAKSGERNFNFLNDIYLD